MRAVDIPHVAQLFILPGRDSQGEGAGQLLEIIFLERIFPCRHGAVVPQPVLCPQ